MVINIKSSTSSFTLLISYHITFRLKVAEDINKSNQPMKRISSGENIRKSV